MEEVIDLEEEDNKQNECVWETCDSRSEEDSDRNKHLAIEYIPLIQENTFPKTVLYPEIEDGFNCYICGFETEKQEEFENHQKRMH